MLVDPRSFRRVVTVRERLLANDEATLDELAADVGLSPTRLIRVFTALFGTTPHQLRTQARLDLARQQLSRGAAVTDGASELDGNGRWAA